MTLKSILKPEGSTMAGIATVAAVFSIYQLNCGPVVQVHATDANLPPLETSRKKSGYASLALVASLFLITKDANLAILGGGTIIAMELTYRHAIMTDPNSNRMVNPSPSSAFEPAENVVPFPYQGETG